MPSTPQLFKQKTTIEVASRYSHQGSTRPLRSALSPVYFAGILVECQVTDKTEWLMRRGVLDAPC